MIRLSLRRIRIILLLCLSSNPEHVERKCWDNMLTEQNYIIISNISYMSFFLKCITLLKKFDHYYTDFKTQFCLYVYMHS